MNRINYEVTGISNQNKFNIGMTVGDIIGNVNADSKYKYSTYDWTYDIQFSDLAYTIWTRLGDTPTETQIENEVARYFNREYMLMDSMQDKDFYCFLYGATFGDYYGRPTLENLQKCDIVVTLFENNLSYGYIGELIRDIQKKKVLVQECLSCGSVEEVKDIHRDSLGWYAICGKCGSTFDVDINDYIIPNGTRVIVDCDIYVVMGNDLENTDHFNDLNYYLRPTYITDADAYKTNNYIMRDRKDIYPM